MPDYRALIFDCDGVLFESKKANLAYYNTVLAELGVEEVTEDQPERAHLCHTAASPTVFQYLLGEELAERALALAGQLDYRRFIPRMVPEPGMRHALEQVSTRFTLGVATNRGTSMEPILDHFGLEHLFSAVVTSRHVARPKPYPDMLLLAAELLECRPQEVLFIGDSELDLEAAAKAGVGFLGYKNATPGCDSVASFGELLERVLGS